jgi:hypothetical protein
MRVRFDVRVYGHVVMPEHVHLLLSEPAAFFQVSAQGTGASQADGVIPFCDPTAQGLLTFRLKRW